MRITLQTTADSFSQALAQEVGYDLQMAQSLEALGESTMRSRPIQQEHARELVDHLDGTLFAGDGISKINISCARDLWLPGDCNTRIFIRSEMEDREYGNIARFMAGSHPGLTLSNIIEAAQFKSKTDKTGQITLGLPRPGDFMAFAVNAYLTSLINTDRGYGLKVSANGNVRAIALELPEPAHGLSVPYAYKLMKDLIHRDRAISMPCVDQLSFNQRIISTGCRAMGVNCDPTASADEKLLALTDRVRETLIFKNGEAKIEGFDNNGVDPSASIAHILLIDAYLINLRREYPDIQETMISHICELSNTSPLLEAGYTVLGCYPDHRFDSLETRPVLTEAPEPRPDTVRPAPSLDM
mgnify:CR=1 FL=1